MKAQRDVWLMVIPGTQEAPGRSTETVRRHALEKRDKLLDQVQVLEVKLGITARWRPGNPEWIAAKKLVSLATYQSSLDKLEGLIVARMFELTKMNMSRTGNLIQFTDIVFTKYYRRLQASKAHR